ncbi:hypothetical protein BGW80DRAFT_1340566 [Lactifluus volemus]|nr:hypothetical protein BGW80DRAFT_1340419 [Lactifluus volemus]KAH9967624.1 hypothetical protein BGW80DRAFT_1340566 [Lactifluus volemus]
MRYTLGRHFYSSSLSCIPWRSVSSIVLVSVLTRICLPVDDSATGDDDDMGNRNESLFDNSSNVLPFACGQTLGLCHVGQLNRFRSTFYYLPCHSLFHSFSCHFARHKSLSHPHSLQSKRIASSNCGVLSSIGRLRQFFPLHIL